MNIPYFGSESVLSYIFYLIPHYLFPTGLADLFTIFFYFCGFFIVVGCVTALISIINHVKGLISRV